MPVYPTHKPKGAIPPAGIYLIRCTANGKVYVGQSGAIRSRWSAHRRALEAGSASPALQRDWQRYGADSFAWSVIEPMPILSYLGDRLAAERGWIEHYQANDPRHGYNRIRDRTARYFEWLATARWEYKPRTLPADSTPTPG